MLKNMEEAIKNYFIKMKNYPDYYNNDDFSDVCEDILIYLKQKKYMIDRKENTSVELLEKELGYKLPTEIEIYINYCWHPSICGYYGSSECIVLFPVLKKQGDSSDDILKYQDGILTMVKEWEKNGCVNKYIPIGWLGYSGSFVLYEINTCHIYLEDYDVDGKVLEQPIANSLKELIMNLKIGN
jgi:hypothetical protein